MEEKSERAEGSSLTITFTGRSDASEFRHKGDHMAVVPPHQRLACFYCGYWMSPFPQSSSFGISTRMYCAISDAFQADHRRCSPRPAGKEAFVMLKREWDDFMEQYPEQRKKWEKDYGVAWARSNWAEKYDAWLAKPIKKDEKKKLKRVQE